MLALPVKSCISYVQLTGVSLTGEVGSTHLFAQHVQQPAMTAQQLMKSSKWSRSLILKRKKEQVDPRVQQAVWDLTMNEVDRGWLQGPFNEHQVRMGLGPLFVASKRFGLEQADRIKQIEYLSESHAAFGAGYKFDLEGVGGINM